MRSILLVFAVFFVGIFLGHEFWPQSHPDPAYHFRFHRGKIPHNPSPTPPAPADPSPKHGRVHQPTTN